MGHSFAHASTPSRGRAHHGGPKPQHDHDTHGHDPILGQLVQRYLAGEIELTQPVLVGLHRSLGSPGRVRAAIESRRGASTAGAAPATPAFSPRFAPATLPEHLPHAHASTAAPHEAHHSLGEQIVHGLHKLHAGHEVMEFVEEAGEGFDHVRAAMTALGSGTGAAHDLKTVSDSLAADRTIGGQLSSLVGKLASPLAKTLGGGTIGKVIKTGGKLLQSPWVQAPLQAVNVGMSIHNGYENAVASSENGKLLTAAAAGTGAALIEATPPLRIANALLPDALKPSRHLSGMINGVAGIVEGVQDRDEHAMAKMHDASLKGEYGWVMKQASRLGDVVADQL